MIRRPLALGLVVLALAACTDPEAPLATAPEHPSYYNTNAGYWVVTKLADTDDGICNRDCSLREAIAVAAPGDEIRFDGKLKGGTITLAGTQLTLNKDLTITGPGANHLSVNGNDQSRVFEIGEGKTVSISGLTITGGALSDYMSGAGVNNFGTLTLIEVAVSGNSTDYYGGGIQNFATLTLLRSTVSNNTALFGGGGIDSSGTLTLINSTVSGNTAGNGSGGGIGVSRRGAVWLAHSTISNNTAHNGGGIFLDQTNRSVLSHTLVAGNRASAYGPDVFENESQVQASYSLVGNSYLSGITSSNGNIVDVSATDLKLGPLAHNGGPTKTHALLSGSVAIDAGDPALTPPPPSFFDQRGTGYPRLQGPRVDIGAFEFSTGKRK